MTNIEKSYNRKIASFKATMTRYENKNNVKLARSKITSSLPDKPKKITEASLNKLQKAIDIQKGQFKNYHILPYFDLVDNTLKNIRSSFNDFLGKFNFTGIEFEVSKYYLDLEEIFNNASEKPDFNKILMQKYDEITNIIDTLLWTLYEYLKTGMGEDKIAGCINRLANLLGVSYDRYDEVNRESVIISGMYD